MAEKAYLAIDIGASSGRHLIGRFDGQRLRLEEVHRFENGPVDLDGRLYWDLPGLWTRVRQGLTAARAAQGGDAIVSVGVDTWGVDFGLLGATTSCWGILITIATAVPTASSNGPSRLSPAKRFSVTRACSSCSSTRSINSWQ